VGECATGKVGVWVVMQAWVIPIRGCACSFVAKCVARTTMKGGYFFANNPPEFAVKKKGVFC